MDWKQYESIALTYFFMTNGIENKSKIKAIVLKEIKEMNSDEDGLLISNDSTGRKEISEKMKRCQGRRDCAESNTGATNWKFKENRVD